MYEIEFEGGDPLKGVLHTLCSTQRFGDRSLVAVLVAPRGGDDRVGLFECFESAQKLLGTVATVHGEGWNFRGIVSGAELHHSTHHCEVLLEDGFAVLDSTFDSGVYVESTMSRVAADVVPEPCELEYLGEEDPPIRLAIRHRESAAAFLRRLSARHGLALWCEGLTVKVGKIPAPDADTLELGRDIQHYSIRSGWGREKAVTSGIAFGSANETTDVTTTLSEEGAGAVEAATIERRDKTSQALRSHVTAESVSRTGLEERAGEQAGMAASSRIEIRGQTAFPIRLGATLSIGTSLVSSGGGPPESLVVTSVSSQTPISGELGEQHWHFEARSIRTLVSPPHTHRSPQLSTAIVEGTRDAGKRIKVRFVWDPDRNVTPWIRMLTAAWGEEHQLYVPPRKGDTVVVVWDDDDDDPFAAGAVASGRAVCDPDAAFFYRTAAGQTVMVKESDISIRNEGAGAGPSEILIQPAAVSIKLSEGHELLVDSQRLTMKHAGGTEVSLSSGGMKAKSSGTIVLSTEAGASIELSGPKVSINGQALEII